MYKSIYTHIYIWLYIHICMFFFIRVRLSWRPIFQLTCRCDMEGRVWRRLKPHSKNQKVKNGYGGGLSHTRSYLISGFGWVMLTASVVIRTQRGGENCRRSKRGIDGRLWCEHLYIDVNAVIACFSLLCRNCVKHNTVRQKRQQYSLN